MATNASTGSVVWKHIGLHGHSVGTFSCEADRILWKSAIAGRDDAGSGTQRSIPASLIAYAQWTIFGRNGHLRIGTKQQDQQNARQQLKHELRFDGFPAHDFELLKEALDEKFKVELKIHNVSAAGAQYGLTEIKGKNLVFRHCLLDEMNEEGQEFEPRAEDEMMSLDLHEVSQCVLPGNNRNEIEIQFPESDTVEAGTDQLVSIRMYIPPDPEADPADKEADTAAETLQKLIMQTANIRKTTGDVIVSFDQTKGTFLTPRGRYGIELYDIFLRLRGQKYDYKIKYDDINRLFLLPKPDEVHMAFVIALDKAIRQGQQRYQYLVLQAPKDPDEVLVNLDAKTLEKEYAGELQPVMRGSLANLIAKTFKVIAKKKVFIPGKFANATQQACVKCAYRANEGLLYPLEKQFIFIHKPPILIRNSEIESIEFQRYAGGQGSTRNFDLCINLNSSATGGGAKEYTFQGIDRSDYQGLYNFITSKNIRIKNLQGESVFGEPEVSRKPVYNEDEIYGGPAMDEDDGSPDEDFDENAEEEGESSGSDTADDDDLGSEVDEDLDSDLEEARKEGKKKRKSKQGGSDSESETETTPKKKPKSKVVKTKSGDSDDDEPAKKTKKKKDPNAPKRPMSAYMFFTNENRGRIKEENPDAEFGQLGKLAGAEWKSLSSEDKEKYDVMATADKERYKEAMKDYTQPDDSDSSPAKGKKGKRKKDPNAPKKATTSFLAFSNEIRPKVKADYPDASFGELGKKIGEMFRNLTSEEKEKYEQIAQKDKQRYKRQMDDFQSSKKGGKDENESDADGKADSDSEGVNDVIDDEDDDDESDSDED
ncbi:hypothetical protein MPSEU_000601600 [Mayamaea pseudoterrestris]|nr:hypothetical protein MPSEU_000601600 [Mayamaea pseudoterrestris]